MPRAALRESARVCVDLARESGKATAAPRRSPTCVRPPLDHCRARALIVLPHPKPIHCRRHRCALAHRISHGPLIIITHHRILSHGAIAIAHTRHACTHKQKTMQTSSRTDAPPAGVALAANHRDTTRFQSDRLPPPASECAHASRCTKRTTRKKREPRRDAAGRRRECRRLPPTPLSALPRSPPPALSPQQGLGGRHPRKQPRHTAPARAHPPAPWPASR